MVARSHPPVVFGAAATVPSAQPDLDVSAFDADAEKLKARYGSLRLSPAGCKLLDLNLLQGSTLPHRFQASF